MQADRIEDYLEIAGLVVALASAVAAMTPSDSDNRIVGALIRVLDACALNWNRRNPRKARTRE